MPRHFPRRADALLFWFLSVAALALSAVSVAGSLAQVGRTFPGFVVWNNLFVPALGRPDWNGIRAGIPFRVRLAAVDSRPVSDRKEVRAVVRFAPLGAVHRYTFEGPPGHAGATTRTIASQRFTATDWAATMGVYVLNGLAFLLAGLAVFWLKPESRQSRAVLAFGALWGLTLVLAVDLFTAGRFERIYFLLQCLSPAAALHLGLTFPEPRFPVKRSGAPLTWVYAAGLAAGIAENLLLYRSYAWFLPLDNAVYLALAATGALAIGSITLSVFRADSPLARRRARVVLAGSLAAFLIPLPALVAFFLLGTSVSFSLLTLTGFMFPLSIGYAIARHDLFEADRFVKLALGWALITGLVSIGYAGAVLVADRLVAGLALSKSPWFPIAFILAALATIVPLRDRVQRAVDRVFYRSRVDYRSTVGRASERMTTLLDRNAIVAHVVSTLREVLFLDRAAIWEREDEGLLRRGAAEDGAGVPGISRGDPGLETFESRGTILSRDEVEESPKLRNRRAALRSLFVRLDATLLVPLSRSGRVMGLIAVGAKASGGPLSAEDVDVLRTLANETAIALANAGAIEALRSAQARLVQSERLAAIGELSAAVAHGIRNPLAGIRMAAQMGLEDLAAGDPVRENLEDVISEVDKLEAQVRGILDFARPFEPSLAPVDLSVLVDELVTTLRPQLDAAVISVEVKTDAGLPQAFADSAHLGQALQALVVNGMEAMPGGGRVTIRLSPSPRFHGGTRIAVEDTGPGVPPEMRERIFTLFTTTKRTGTGVGLAVVRKIVERHGGTIAIEPAVSGGARFVIDLPAAQGMA